MMYLSLGLTLPAGRPCYAAAESPSSPWPALAGKEAILGLESGRWLGSLPAVSSRSQSSGGRGKKESERSTMPELAQLGWRRRFDSMLFLRLNCTSKLLPLFGAGKHHK
jgi:hypothetical protein